MKHPVSPEPAPRSYPAGAGLPSPRFRRNSWADFQRALDPLAPPQPLRRAAA